MFELMKTLLDHHIHRLWQHYGSYSRVAQNLGLDVRSFRRGRNGIMPKPAARIIIASGKLLALRQLLRELVAAGDLKPEAVRRAWRTVQGSRSQ